MPIFKVTTKPEGSPTFVDENTGVEREYMRITEVGGENQKMAVKHVEAQMWDLHVMKGEPLYEVTDVEQIGE